MESIGSVEDKPLGYPVHCDSPHDVLMLHLLRDLSNNHVISNTKVPMDGYFDGKPWVEQIALENVLEVLDDQWLSSSSIALYIRYLGEVYLSKNTNMAVKFFLRVSPSLVHRRSC
ncbi:hypothetical protein LIER_26176 [Lithospermum erythrorhizon]|uniref:Uncharacterized protein n=1 Tax=Lithospermum erythrorhizon TaxID=34254 RepID=A0AAV3R8Q8_LITER